MPLSRQVPKYFGLQGTTVPQLRFNSSNRQHLTVFFSCSITLIREERAGLSLVLRSRTTPPKYFLSLPRENKLKQVLFSPLSSR